MWNRQWSRLHIFLWVHVQSEKVGVVEDKTNTMHQYFFFVCVWVAWLIDKEWNWKITDFSKCQNWRGHWKHQSKINAHINLHFRADLALWSLELANQFHKWWIWDVHCRCYFNICKKLLLISFLVPQTFLQIVISRSRLYLLMVLGLHQGCVDSCVIPVAIRN